MYKDDSITLTSGNKVFSNPTAKIFFDALESLDSMEKPIENLHFL